MLKTITLLTTGILLNSCGQSFNSNTSDYLLLQSSYCQDQSLTALCEANEVLQTKCTSCHSGDHTTWAAWDTNEEWIASGKVIAGNPEGSSIVSKLKVYGTGGNMPLDASPLTQEEYDKIKAWINSL